MKTLIGNMKPDVLDYAVVVHLYYPDLYDYFQDRLKTIKEKYNLFVTVPVGVSKTLIETIQSDFEGVGILVCENRGRDIAPFLRALETTNVLEHEWILKLHTKKSPHRQEGGAWRKKLVETLVAYCPSAGEAADLIVPEEFLVSNALHIGDNYFKEKDLAARVGIEVEGRDDFLFPAGSMYWARKKVLQKLLSLEIKPEDFEPELGQIDGTLAHAVERIVGMISRENSFAIKTIK